MLRNINKRFMMEGFTPSSKMTSCFNRYVPFEVNLEGVNIVEKIPK